MKVVFQASSAAELVKAAAEWIAPRLGKSEIIILSATRAAADEFVRTLPVAGTLGILRYTVPQFAVSLAGQGVMPATRLAAEAVAARVTHEALKARKLHYFVPVAKSPGFASALATTLGDLRLAGVQPHELKGKGAAGDVGVLLDGYQRELDSRGLADFAKLLGLATEETKSWQPVPVLLLDVAVRSHVEREFIDAICERSPSVFEAICRAEDPPRAPTTASSVAASSSARSSDDHTVGDVKLGVQTALEQMRQFLFLTDAPQRREYDNSVDLFSAPGESLECVEIARRIAHLGIPFDRVAILLRHPDRYQPLVEEALRRAKVPAYFSRGTVRPDPAGRAFLALLACALEKCSASRFAEYLSLGQVPPLDGAGAPPRREPPWTPPDDELLPANDAAPAREPVEATLLATPLAWEKLLVDAAVIGGYERWARRLKGLENELRIQLGSLKAEEQAHRDQLERELERLGNLERFALPLIEDLHALPESADWSDWLTALSNLAARSLVHPEPVLAVLSELRPMADVGPVDLEEVHRVLAKRLRTLREEPPHRRYGRVFIGSIDEARGRSFDVVFLPGLAEGLFPRKASEDPLLLDDVRGAISNRLKRNDDRVAEERQLLRTAAGTATVRFIASYPSLDVGQGRPRVPSFYALEIARAIEGRVPALRSFENRLAANAEARLVWPAPANAEHAIDDAEYDLAWMAEHRNDRGSARYLMSEDTPLGRSLRTRFKRWERKWSSADGFVHADEITHALISGLRPSIRDYSPSSLQHFAACPYRFMLSAVLRLREREKSAAIEQLDPLTRGALVHHIQREFLKWQRSEPCSDLDTLSARLDEVLERVSTDYAERIAPAIERVWRSELDDVRTDLRGWVLALQEQLAEWEPQYFELGFGIRRLDEEHDPSSSEAPVATGAVRVRGSIDLVERHRQRGTLRITDHKTGRAPEREPTYIAGGTVLQPVLYSLAAEQMLGATAETGRLFYCTQRGNYTESRIDIDARARQYFNHAMRLIDRAMEDAFLPAAPADGACGLCEYAPVCGPNEETRIRRWKDPDMLDELNQLRSLP